MLKLKNYDLIKYFNEDKDLIDLPDSTEIDFINIDTNIMCEGDLNCEGELECIGNLNCEGDLNCEGELECIGNLNCEGSLNCEGNLNCEGDVNCEGDLDCKGDLDCDGDLKIKGEKTENYLRITSTLGYVIYITDNYLKIGCEYHSHKDWWAFSDKRILEMDGPKALRFWNKNKSMIKGICDSLKKSEGKG